MNKNILEIKDFSVSFDTYAGEVQAVRDVSFHLKEGEVLAIVGESGSGKSVMTQSIMKLLASPPARIKSGTVLYDGEDISEYGFKRLRRFKGSEIAYVFQDPMTSLNPTLRISTQIVEGICAHSGLSKAQAQERALALLRDVGIPNPEKRLAQFPHELSGGMRQRVMIAIAMAMGPKIMIADEPTTALDVTIQSQILGLIKELNQKTGMSVLLITHDMGIVASMAQRVLVMYGGRIIESGSVFDIFDSACHPYTRSLLAAVPRLDLDSGEPLEYIVGSPPDMLSPPKGCPFAPRCRFSMQICCDCAPEKATVGEDHETYCWLTHASARQQRLRFEQEYGY